MYGELLGKSYEVHPETSWLPYNPMEAQKMYQKALKYDMIARNLYKK